MQVPFVALPELLGVSSLGPLDVAVELRGAWRQDEQMQGTLLARCLELGHKLTAAVDLDRPQRKRRAFLPAGVGALRPPFSGGDGTPGGIEKDPAPFQGRKDASHHRGGDVPAASAHEEDKLVLAPAVLLA